MKLLLIVLTMSFFISACSSVDSDAVVATVGDEKIYFDEFELYAAPQVRKVNLLGVNPENKERLLKMYVELVVLAQKAETVELEGLKKYQETFAQKQKVWIAQYFYWDLLVNELFTPEEISTFYDRMDSEFKVRHIIVGYKGAANSDVVRSKEEALELASKIYSEALEGSVSFGELAKKYSEGPSAPKGGLLPQFGPGKMEKPFENAVFNLSEGETSKPVETKFGYHVILLEERSRSVEHVSLSDPNERVRTYQNLLGAKNREVQALFLQKTDSLLKLIDFSYNDENIEWFSNRMAEISKRKDFPSIQIIEDEADFDRILFQTNQIQYTIRNLTEDLGTRIRGYARRMITLDEAKKGLQNFASVHVWSAAGIMAGFEKKRWVQIQENNFRRTEIGALYRQEKIRPLVKVTDEEILDFYNRNIDRYKVKAKIEVSLIRQADIELAAEALKKAVAGENWKDLVNKYSQGSKFEKQKAGLLGSRKEDDFGDVTKKAFEFGPDKIVPELVLNGNTFFIVKTGMKTPESVRPFEKVKKDIHSAVRLRNEHTLMDEMVEAHKEEKGFTYNSSAIQL